MPQDKLSEKEKQAVLAAIREAEQNTSGEIRVHLENHCKRDVLDRAAEVFAALQMHETKLRNGVLFYLALKDHRFAILGDSGINRKVPAHFWEEIRNFMTDRFKEGKFVEGLAEGIRMAGQQLSSHFPYQANDQNELPNDISFHKN